MRCLCQINVRNLFFIHHVIVNGLYSFPYSKHVLSSHFHMNTPNYGSYFTFGQLTFKVNGSFSLYFCMESEDSCSCIKLISSLWQSGFLFCFPCNGTQKYGPLRTVFLAQCIQADQPGADQAGLTVYIYNNFLSQCTQVHFEL